MAEEIILLPRNADITQDCKIGTFKYNDTAKPFLHLEIINADNKKVYVLLITMDDIAPQLTIVEWGAVTGGNIKKYTTYIHDVIYLSYQHQQMRPDDFTHLTFKKNIASGVVPVMDRATYENISYDEYNGQFISGYTISHQFILGKYSEDTSNSNLLRTYIKFVGIESTAKSFEEKELDTYVKQ